MNDRDAWIHFACAHAASVRHDLPINAAAFADRMLDQLKEREDNLEDSPTMIEVESRNDALRVRVESDESDPIFTFRLDENVMNITPPTTPKKIAHDDVDRMRQVFRSELSGLSLENTILKENLAETQRLLAAKSDETALEFNALLAENDELKHQLMALTADVKKYMASVEAANAARESSERKIAEPDLRAVCARQFNEIKTFRKERELFSVKWSQIYKAMEPHIKPEDKNVPISATNLVEYVSRLASVGPTPPRKVPCPLPLPGGAGWGWKRRGGRMCCENFGIRINLEPCYPTTRLGEIQWYIGKELDQRWSVGLSESKESEDNEILYLGTADTEDLAMNEAENAARMVWYKLNSEPKRA